MGNTPSKGGQAGGRNAVALGLSVGLTAAAAAGLTWWAYQMENGDSDPAGKHGQKSGSSDDLLSQDVSSGGFRTVCDGDSCRLVWEPSEASMERPARTSSSPLLRSSSSPDDGDDDDRDHGDGDDDGGRCCPSDSLPAVDPENREHKAAMQALKGEVVQISLPQRHDGDEPGTFDAYVVGKPVDGRCVIVAHDVHGFQSGRISTLCDNLAEHGYLVIQPNFFGKEVWNKNWEDFAEFVRQFTWYETAGPIVDGAIDWALNHGAEVGHFGMIGFCWGSYAVWHTSATGRLAAGASFHPSHTRVMGILDEDPLELTHTLKCPQLVYSAGSDAQEDKPEGAHMVIIEDLFAGENDIREFPDMAHGWMSRGDPSKDRIEEAEEGMVKFFKRLL